MWPFKRSSERNISGPVFAALVVSFIGLMFVIGVARWSWLLLDEQIRLRSEVEALKERQAQVETQYEFWLKQVEKKLK